MLGSNVLDVAIGLVLVFLLLSLAATAVREAIAAIYRTRARFLMAGIEDLMQNDRALLEAFYQHPQIFALYQGKTADIKNHPSYIPSRNFSMALMDMAVRGVNTKSAVGATAESTPLTADNVRRYVSGLGNPQVQRMILGALDSAGNDLGQARKEIEAWFDSAMDRVSGRYKRRTTWVLFVIGGAMTILLNVDTIRVGTSFYKSPALRDAAVAMAGHITSDSARPVVRQPAPTTTATPATTGQPATAIPVDPRSALDSLYALRLPIGWSDVVAGNWPAGDEWNGVWRRTVASLFGWLLTAFAVSLGAPFWFDALNKIMVIRSTVKPREKSQEEGSEDRKSKNADSSGSPASGGVAVTREVSAPTIVINPSPPPPVVVAGGVGSPGVAHEWSVGDPEGGIL